MSRLHHYNKTTRTKLKEKIESLPGQVFKREDLSHDHSNREQLHLNRALKAFIEDGLITKIGHGLYAKAEIMSFKNGRKKLVLRESFEDVVMEAFNKMGIKWELGTAIQEYNRGNTTQVPSSFIIKLKNRFRGKIQAEGRTVIFEDNTNAR